MKPTKTHCIRVYFSGDTSYNTQIRFEHYCLGNSTYLSEYRAKNGFLEPEHFGEAFIDYIEEEHPLDRDEEGEERATFIVGDIPDTPDIAAFEFQCVDLPEVGDAQRQECLTALARCGADFAAKYASSRGLPLRYIRSELIEQVYTENVVTSSAPHPI